MNSIDNKIFTFLFSLCRQEYLDDIYEALAETGNPRLLQALESFIETTSDTLSQKNIENERLDTALRRLDTRVCTLSLLRTPFMHIFSTLLECIGVLCSSSSFEPGLATNRIFFEFHQQYNVGEHY